MVMDYKPFFRLTPMVRQDVWATQSSTNTILVFLFLFAQKVN